MKIPVLVLVVSLCFIALDVITGIVKAVMTKTFTSTLMRTGLFHKIGFILCIGLGMLADWGQTIINLGVDIPLTEAICAYICLSEIGSVIENLALINPKIAPSWLKSLFAKLNNSNSEDK